MRTPTTSTYPLDNAWEHAQPRLRALERIYDPASTRRLEALGVGPGWRCLEAGAGGGSVTRGLGACWRSVLPARFHYRVLRSAGAQLELSVVAAGCSGTDSFRLPALKIQELMLAFGTTCEQLAEWSAILHTPARWFPSYAVVA